MFNFEDVAVNHYVDWDWRTVLAVTIVGLVFAGFSCWISFYSKQMYWPTWLSIAARVLPQYVAVLCVWLGFPGLSRGDGRFGCICFLLRSCRVRFGVTPWMRIHGWLVVLYLVGRLR